MLLLIKFPTRGRPKRFFDVLGKYVRFLSNKREVRFLVTCDEDDKSMNCEESRARLDATPDLKYHFGRHRTKVEAINAGMNLVRDWDVLLLASDDMIPQVRGYNSIICEKMIQSFPNTDGVLWFNDGYQGPRLNTLLIVGRKYYERFGFLYHPDYKSLFVDNEFTDTARLLKRQVYFEQVIIRHEHPANTKNMATYDATYSRNDGFCASDRVTYEKRKQYNFDLKLKGKV